MRLDVGSIAVEDVDFGARTALHGHTLVLDREEIRQIVLEDPHFADVDVQVARPGELVRIIHVLDVVEPRWKVAGPGGVFPGFVSPPTTVGDGQTNRLAGVAVVDVGEPVPGEPTHFRERLIDMAGPGGECSPFGQTLNVVLDFKPNRAFFPPGSAEVQDVLRGSPEATAYNRAITLAGMKVAARLGRATQDVQPDDMETFELTPCDPGLLRVVCLYQHRRYPTVYGVPVPLPLGTLIHPNECFDGAVIETRGGSSSAVTYWEQNNAILQELCRRHGKEINFLGCIFFGDWSPYRADKERIASGAAKLARVLHAQAALLMGTNGSNYSIELMWAIQECERAGIKTTLVYYDMGNGPDDPGLVFSVPEADAIVCTGSDQLDIVLPPVQRLIGGQSLIDPNVDPHGEITIPMRYICGATGVQGYNRLTTRFE